MSVALGQQVRLVFEATDAALRNAMKGGGHIIFACDGAVALQNTITNDALTSVGAGGHQVTIVGNQTFRLFYVPTNTALSLDHLGLTAGYGTNGGAVFCDGGTLNASNCVFSANSATPLWGPSSGGAVCNSGGEVNLDSCIFSDNHAHGGSGVFPPYSSTSGTDGCGGAIHNAGRLLAVACTFSNNQVAGSPAYSISGTIGGGVPPPGSAGSAKGGAIWNQGTMRLERSLFCNNTALAGSAANGASGGPFPSPEGGGVAPGQYGGSGGSAFGAIANEGPAASFVNCTFVGNQGIGSDGGNGGNGSEFTLRYVYYHLDGGGGGKGGDGAGAIWSAPQSVAGVTNCTFVSNLGVRGSGGLGGAGGRPGSPGENGVAGGGILIPPLTAAEVLVINSVLSANSPSGAAGTISDLGHNLCSDVASTFTNSSSHTGVASGLGPLADNGGPSFSIALLPGSPAIDAADPASAPPWDQRGMPRPLGPAPDLGAYEFGSPPILSAKLTSPGAIDLTATGLPNQVFVLKQSADLSSWSIASTNRIGANGVLRWSQDISPGAQMFYQMRISP